MDLDINFDFSIPTSPQELHSIMHNLHENIKNLSEVLEKLSENEKSKYTSCDISDISWLFEEKCKMLDNTKTFVKSSENNIKLPFTDGEILIDLYKTLVNENKQQIQTLKLHTEKLNDQQKKLSELQNFLHILNLNQKSMETREKNSPVKQEVHLLKNQTITKMQEMRKILHTILDAYFAETDIKDLIKDLTTAYFEGGDRKYVSAENYSFADVELLKKASLVVEDPYDKSRIKIDDII